VKHDYTDAVKWHAQAADQGHTHAQFNLGANHATGESTLQHFTKALQSGTSW
jgi:TPR repeat protein